MPKKKKGKLKKQKRPSWDEYFMVIAKLVASRSTCLSRPNGAVIVKNKRIVATGYNGSIPGVAHCSDEGKCFRRSLGVKDSEKTDFCRAVHAEANALIQAAKLGISVQGATIYQTMAPCYTCLKLLASAGIKKVFFEINYESKNKFRDKIWTKARKESGIEFEQLKVKKETLKYILPFLVKETSKRRLKSE
jgi:dCMP deaminase